MAKDFKVMRKKHIYRSGSGPVRVIAAVVAAAVLFAAGWFLYQPAYNWVMGLAQPTRPEQTQQPEEEQIPAEPPQTPASAEENWAEELRAVWVPNSASGSTAALEKWIGGMPGDPVNAVVLELKDQQGRVRYQSGVAEVAQAGAQNSEAFDLAAAADRLHRQNCLVLGRIHAFEDSTAATVLEDGKVNYQNTSYAWLDNSVSEGGKPWLNPYSAQAQDYIAGLVEEALALGVDGIVLDGVQFPTGFSLELADYGETGGLTRTEVLSSFVTRVEELVEARGGVGCWIFFEAEELYVPEAMGELGPYGGRAESLAQAHRVMVDVQPAAFGAADQPEEGLVLPEKPVQNPGETVAAALRQLKLPADKAMVAPVVQAYTDQEIAPEYNLVYDREAVDAQIAAAEDQGVRCVVLFDPNGAYSSIS